jgi:glutathione peroxidase
VISKSGGTQMRRLVAMVAALAALAGVPVAQAGAGPMHEVSFTSIEGAPLPMSGFAGQAVLVVNTASLCGFTRQYGALQRVYEAYRGRGLVVLGVPSNDFGGQEPGSAAEIKQFCEVNFAVDFPLTEKQVVTGEAAHPFFRQVVALLGPEAAPRWNFHKFLVTPDGQLAGSWPSRVEPDAPELVRAIEALLPR